MSMNGMNRMRERISTGRPGLDESVLAKLLMYKFKGLSSKEVSKRIKIAPTTVNKYWDMHQNNEIDPVVVKKAEDMLEMTESIGGIAQSMGIKDDLTPAVEPGEKALIPVDEIINMTAVSKILNAAIKEASGDFIEEKITGLGVKAANGPDNISTKFGFVISTDNKICVELKRNAPNSRHLMTLIDYFKQNHNLDLLKSVKDELGINKSTAVDMSQLTPEEASSKYQQLMNGGEIE